ncbi:MAG: arabinogalactan endo-1,4-beta-galactosidase, partial [Prevotella sp.]|nr:arabinogalactan endo-1,4-beta-galactosidase [Prevotella sp.]
VLDEFMLFLNGNKFWYSSGLTKMKAFRAYFNIYDILTSVENAEAKVFFTFAETTGIKNVNDGDADGNTDDSWYTIDGQKLNREPVQKGIYIHQGKKINK